MNATEVFDLVREILAVIGAVAIFVGVSYIGAWLEHKGAAARREYDARGGRLAPRLRGIKGGRTP